MAIGGQNSLWKHSSHSAPTSNVDYSASTRNVTLSMDGEEVDATTFGNLFRDYERSFVSGTFEAEYKFGTAMWVVVADIFTNGTSVDFEYSPNGSTGGYPKITGAMVCTNLNSPASVGELLVFTATFRINGTITATTH
jgi:hypothetical protein